MDTILQTQILVFFKKNFSSKLFLFMWSRRFEVTLCPEPSLSLKRWLKTCHYWWQLYKKENFSSPICKPELLWSVYMVNSWARTSDCKIIFTLFKLNCLCEKPDKCQAFSVSTVGRQRVVEQIEVRLRRYTEQVGWEHFCMVGKCPSHVSLEAPSLLWACRVLFL